MKLRIEAGLIIKSLNTGWIGLIISWIFQFYLTYIIGDLRLSSSLINYQLERVPNEVAKFAVFHSIKGRKIEQIRKELSKMGWTEKKDQNEVLEAIGLIDSEN